MNSETSNYLRRGARWTFAVAAATALLSRFFWFIVRRAWPSSRRCFQPTLVRRKRRRLLQQDAPALDHPMSGYAASGALTLAVGSLVANGDSTWSATFADDEITVSLHRWNWLLRSITDDPVPLTRDQGVALMRSWIRTCQSQPKFGRDAYSTGERIVNGSLFLRLTGDREIPPDIANAYQRMARQIAVNIEYSRSEQTGNHAFNNARALLFAGALAGVPMAVDLAYAICQERLPKLVTADGFMREGSSHYHFLFTRWVLEMLWLVEGTTNEAFAALLKPYATRLVERCWFFLVQCPTDGSWQIPLVGDVSPDFPPDWLIGLPWSALACAVYRPDHLPVAPRTRGWHSLFRAVEGTSAPRPEQTAHFARSGWARVDRDKWTIFVRAASSDGVLSASHAHHDLGGFTLFRDGSPLVVDCGRLDYTLSPVGCYGRSARAHSTVLVDNLGSTTDGPSWFSDRYRAVHATLSVGCDGRDTVITLSHDGFTRLRGRAGRHQRRFRLGASRFVVEDRIEGSEHHHVRLRFHFAPGVDLRESAFNSWTLGDTGVSFRPDDLPQVVIQRGQTDPSLGGLFFPKYGCQKTCETLDLSGTVSLPVLLTHELVVTENL